MQVQMPTWEGRPPPLEVRDYFVGIDLAQTQDPTALAVVERTVRPWQNTTAYACRELRRWPLGTPFPQIAGELAALLARSAVSANVIPLGLATVVVDVTGVGHAVVDMVERAVGSPERVVRVVVTAGQAAGFDRGAWQVPRKELIGVLQTSMQTGKLSIASSLPEARTLVAELQTFKAKATPASSDALENWREREHDDLVLALAIPIWFAEQNHAAAWEDNQPLAFAGKCDPYGSW